MALLYFMFVIAIFYWQLNNVRSGKTIKRKAVGLYAIYIISPVVLYGVVFGGLIGVEELTSISIIGEEYARSLVFVIVGGLVVSMVAIVIFSIFLFVVKRKNMND